MRGLNWGDLTNRLSTMAERNCVNRGLAIVSIEIIVDANGQPIFWTEPKVSRIEPRVGGGYALEKIVQALSPSNFGKE